MLKTIGVKDLDGLFATIPETVRLKRPLALQPALSEIDLRNHLREISRMNAHGEEWAMFLGAGSYSHYIPSVVAPLVSRGEFLTAYTPYQPEISQGTLQAIFEFQTMMAEIMGMDFSNASQYDGATAAAEGVRLALSKTERSRVLIARNLHPEYRKVIHTYLRNEEVTLEEIEFTPQGTLDRQALAKRLGPETACVVAATPNFFGVVEDLTDVGNQAREAGALFITVTTEPLSFGLFKPPGEMGADIAVAEGQSFGNSISFGGPSLGIFTARKEYLRASPGRLVGETVDADGHRGFVLTLATREQHIRRERATSNICTNVSLCALAATITLSCWGKKGFEELARLNYDRACDLKRRLAALPGVRILLGGTTFNEFVISTPRDPEELTTRLLNDQVIPGVSLKEWYPELANPLLVCVTEMNTDDQIEKLENALRRHL